MKKTIKAKDLDPATLEFGLLVGLLIPLGKNPEEYRLNQDWLQDPVNQLRKQIQTINADLNTCLKDALHSIRTGDTGKPDKSDKKSTDPKTPSPAKPAVSTPASTSVDDKTTKPDASPAPSTTGSTSVSSGTSASDGTSASGTTEPAKPEELAVGFEKWNPLLFPAIGFGGTVPGMGHVPAVDWFSLITNGFNLPETIEEWVHKIASNKETLKAWGSALVGLATGHTPDPTGAGTPDDPFMFAVREMGDMGTLYLALAGKKRENGRYVLEPGLTFDSHSV